MDGLLLRKAKNDEIDLMTKARVEYCLREMISMEQDAYGSFYDDVKEWTFRNVSEGKYLGYFGYLGPEMVCFAGLLLYELPPIVKMRNRKQGYVLSFFTYPKFRRRGIGNELMKYMVQDAKEMGITQLVLIATDDGVPIYRKNGFAEPSMVYMEKNLEISKTD